MLELFQGSFICLFLFFSMYHRIWSSALQFSGQLPQRKPQKRSLFLLVSCQITLLMHTFVFPFMVAKSLLNEMLKRLNRFPPGLEETFALSEVSIKIYMIYYFLTHFPKYPSLDAYPLQLIKSIELQGTDKFRRIVLDAPSTVRPRSPQYLQSNYTIHLFFSIHRQLFD